MKQIEELERKITATISQIKLNKVTPADSKIGSLFVKLKPLDEASYERLMSKYKVVLSERKNNNS